MPMSTYESLRELLDARKKTYGAAVSRLAISTQDIPPRVIFGRLDFLGSHDEALPELEHDYGKLRLIRTPLDVGAGVAFVHEISEKKHLSIGDLDLSLSGSLSGTGLPYVASQQRFGIIRPEWPSNLYYFNLDGQSQGHPPQQPLAKLNLPLYPDGMTAVAEFCGLQYGTGVSSQIVFVLPDFRARISAMRILERKVVVSVEAGEETLRNLRVKFYLESNGGHYRSPDLATESGSAELDYEGDIKLAMVHLLSAISGESIDNRTFNRYWEAGAEGVTVEASELRIRELIRGGEGSRTELKQKLPENEHQFLDTVVSLANTKGGTILVGVSDNGEIVGLPNPDDVQVTITNWISDKCDPRPDFQMYTIQIDQKTIIVVDLPEGSNKPYQDIDRGIFVRRGSSNRQARISEVEEMFRDRGVTGRVRR